MRTSIMIWLRDKKSLTGIDLQLPILAHPFLMFGHTFAPPTLPPTWECLEEGVSGLQVKSNTNRLIIKWGFSFLEDHITPTMRCIK